ncbi:type I-Fv CRISPR-associated protein Cas5fv [Shewanella oncorhynchi]|uniref:Type I-Fv CRISPR-associated protein Cas5fv n=1 Tax=Shewanella oncorhynchi TaxID=2726434 RepID=A0AA50KGA3_9GAMM|nr:type I-Fv CRISPR-associated protein Cas5fv [Shewanella oncorhynchi]WMB74096.1 type I-Fv CRISPR-associated protein Cas5fv [Shewanella oncorhynchi]
MKIIIEYDSCWRNAFLGGSNNEPVPKKGREFLGSMTSLKKEGNFKVCENTLDTVMGVLNRLIGDQRKLYQARSKMYESAYYFEALEDKVSFIDKPQLTNEISFIRNMNGSTDQNAFTGMIKVSDPVFTSEYSQQFWGVLDLDFTQLCDFIIKQSQVVGSIELNPLSIINRLESLNQEKALENSDDLAQVLKVLNEYFPDIEYLNNKGLITPISIYCSALYLQLARLETSFNMTTAKTKAGGISGISKRGFTKKDFMDRYTTGPKKTIWGNPFIKKEKIKGQGEVTSMMTKASGQLEISIDVDRNKAQEIKSLIENAGVSSFYLGKKGLAYVSNIRI